MAATLNVAQRAQGLLRRPACVGSVLAAAVEARAHAARGDVRGTRGALARASLKGLITVSETLPLAITENLFQSLIDALTSLTASG
jgi:hypothetical protein